MALATAVILAAGANVVVGEAGSSAGYVIAIDGIAAGGGAASSGSFMEPASAIGQGVAYGYASSAGYQDQAGVVQAWEANEYLEYLLGRSAVAPPDLNNDGGVDVGDLILSILGPSE